MNRTIADKELIEYKGDVYVVCKKCKGEVSYNSCVTAFGMKVTENLQL